MIKRVKVETPALLVQSASSRKWYEEELQQQLKQEKEDSTTTSKGTKREIKENAEHVSMRKPCDEAKELLRREEEAYKRSHRSRHPSDAAWMETISSSKGTRADRLAVAELQVSTSPVHSLPTLRALIDEFTTNSRKAVGAHRGPRSSTGGGDGVDEVGAGGGDLLATLQSLFTHHLLPQKRKLIKLEERPFEKEDDKTSKNKPTSQLLILWAFESELKSLYARFITAVEALASTAPTIEAISTRACTTLAELLAARPEAENQLLTALVNKLGHPAHRVAASVAHLLETVVLRRHPRMGPFVADEVEQLLFRRNIPLRARHYGLHLLSKMRLQVGEPLLAVKLINIYLRMFTELQKGDGGMRSGAGARGAKRKRRGTSSGGIKGEVPHASGSTNNDSSLSNKLLTLLVTGIQRALPYAKGHYSSESLSQLGDQLHSLYALVHTTLPRTTLTIFQLLHQIHIQQDGALPDRFYSSLYRRMMTLQENTGSMSAITERQLFSLLYKVLLNDQALVRVRAFVKRLLQLALASMSPGFVYASLAVCSTLVKERSDGARVMRLPAAIAPTMNETLSKEKKRRLNIPGATTSAAAVNSNGGVAVYSSGPAFSFDEEDEEENYKDVDDANDEGSSHASKAAATAGWIHRQQESHHHRLPNGRGESPAPPRKRKESAKISPGGGCSGRSGKTTTSGGEYQPLARNPLFSRADLSDDWELVLLAQHYHPKVAALARRLASSSSSLHGVGGHPNAMEVGEEEEEEELDDTKEGSGGRDPLEEMSAASFLRKLVIGSGGGSGGEKKAGKEEEDDDDDGGDGEGGDEEFVLDSDEEDN